MCKRLPNGLASIYRNPYGPARMTGIFFPWIVEINGQETYCDTRAGARAVLAEYRETYVKD